MERETRNIEELRESYRLKAWMLGAKFVMLEPLAFYRDIFPEGSFQEAGRTGDGKPNGILLEIGETMEGRNPIRRQTVTDDLKAIRNVEGVRFAVMSPVAYFGKTRHAGNARELHAFAIDLDGVDADNLEALLSQAETGVIPYPTHIVNSGGGLHLYYCLTAPEPLYPAEQRRLRAVKYALTDMVWKTRTSRIRKKQMQGILQAFRVVGTQTKLGEDCVVQGFRTGVGAVDLQYLLSFLPDGGTEGLRQWPGARFGVRRGRRWRVNRRLYDWWKERIRSDVTVGHRYFSILALAVFAAKCGISAGELWRDAFACQGPLDALTVDAGNRFTDRDVHDALKAFGEEAVTYPRAVLSRLTGVPMRKSKRNGRKRGEHLAYAREIRARRRSRGEIVSGGGRPEKKAEIQAYAARHPDATKASIARELGVSRTTVVKWL